MICCKESDIDPGRDTRPEACGARCFLSHMFVFVHKRRSASASPAAVTGRLMGD